MNDSSRKRIVVTGLGLVSPFGVGVDRAWNAMLNGESCIKRITHFDPAEYACQIAGQVPGTEVDGGFNPNDFLTTKDQKKMGRFIQLGMASTQEAVEDAGIDSLNEEQKLRTGVLLGSGIGGIPEIERTHKILLEKGPRRVSPFFIPEILINLLSGHVSMKYGFKGPNSSTVTACATAAHALGTGLRMIQYGEADVVVAGGAEAAICGTAMAGFASAKALSFAYNDSPELASRPFDQARDGFIMSEGAATLVLEEYEHAKARGAKIYAELSGFAQTGDAYHMTSPSPDGSGGIRAMELSLADAGLNASDVQYVNAHATSTPAGDKIESRSIETVFGSDIILSGTKSMTGHLLGAAAGIEAIICIKSLMEQKVLPTINLENPSEECKLDYVSNTARDMQLDAVLSNSFGFGGTNASLIFKKV